MSVGSATEGTSHLETDEHEESVQFRKVLPITVAIQADCSIHFDKLSLRDCVWLKLPNMHVNGVFFFKDKLSVKDINEIIGSQIPKMPRFASKIIQEGIIPYWETLQQLRIFEHVTEETLSKGIDKASIRKRILEIANKPMDMTRPLWDLHLMHIGEESLVIMRVHHCISDGQGLVQALMESANQTLPEATPQEQNSSASLISRFCTSIKTVASLTYRMWRGQPDPLSCIKRSEWLSRFDVDWLDEPFSLADLKAIAAKLKGTHATVNDVLLAILAGALYHYFEEKQAPRNPLHCYMPVSLMRKSELRFGNDIGSILVELDITENEPLERLSKIHNSMNAIKNSPEAYLFSCVEGIMPFMPTKINNWFYGRVLEQTSLFMSNVRGPESLLSFNGHELKNLLWFGRPFGNIALGCPVVSYDGKVNMIFTVDPDVIPDTSLLQSHIQTSFNELHNA